MNYYRRYIGDYQKKTPRLSMLDHGAYNLLLDHYYGEEKPLPLDKKEIYTMVRAMSAEDRKAVDKVLARYFVVQEDGYHNARADEEIEVAKQARENGSKGGRKKTGIRTGNGTGVETEDRTGTVTGEVGGSGHPPTTTLQPPAASLPANPQLEKPSAATRRAAKGEGRTVEVWNAYSQAYEKRYGVPPVRNRKVNGQLAQVVERLGQEAPAVSTFYLGHNKGLYVSSRHCVDLLLRDAEGLRTEWATGRKVTDTEARQADQTAAHGDQAQRMLQKHGAH